MGQIRVFSPLAEVVIVLASQVLAQCCADRPAALPGGKGTQPADQGIVVAGSQAKLRPQRRLRAQFGLRNWRGLWLGAAPDVW